MENSYDNFSEDNFLPGIGKENAFVQPKGYFESFYGKMMNRIEVEQELEEFKILSGLDRTLKFAIPQNYFEKLESILEYRYELSLFPGLQSIGKDDFEMPSANYFETLGKRIEEKIELSEELNEFKILSSLKKDSGFAVTPNYFETTNTANFLNQTETPVISIFTRIKVVVLHPRMAYAASVILIAGLVMFWYLNKSESGLKGRGDCLTLACLQKSELLNDKNINEFDDDNLYDMVDVDMLDKNVSEAEEGLEDSLLKEINE